MRIERMRAARIEDRTCPPPARFDDDRSQNEALRSQAIEPIGEADSHATRRGGDRRERRRTSHNFFLCVSQCGFMS